MGLNMALDRLYRYSVMSLFLGVVGVVILASSSMVYNIFFHPLKQFPGPKLWAASRLPWCWNQYNGRLHVRLLELHENYGSIVRIAPNELSYTTETAWKTIYGHRSTEMGRDPHFRLHTPTGIQNIQTADRETHTRQRRLLSHAFSEKALREQEGILQSYVSKLIAHFSSRYASPEAFNMVDWFNFITFDLIGDMAFGENFGCLDRGGSHFFVDSVRGISKELTYAQMLRYYGVFKLHQYFVTKNAAGPRMRNMNRIVETVNQRVQKVTDRKDFLHYVLAANGDKAMSQAEINANAFSLSIAGAESSATALSGATFQVLKNPSVYRALVQEIRSAFKCQEEITLASTVSLEYLDCVLTETLRLYPPVAITLPRVVPDGGETIDEVFVPSGVTVGVNHYSCYRHSRNFHRPTEFLPERWMKTFEGVNTGFATDVKACMQPFSVGPRSCLGKNMAKAEMRLIMARLLWNFDLMPVDGLENWIAGQKIFGFWVKSPLLCKLSLVERD